MAANTLTISYDSDNKVLNQISEANGSSLYRLRESDKEYTVNVRHSTEKAVGGSAALERHNVELSIRTYPTADLPVGKTESAYIVIRSDPNSDGTGSIDLVASLVSLVVDHSLAIVEGLTTI